jgi:hypothetical protein
MHSVVIGDDEQSLDGEVSLAGFDAAKKPSIHAQCRSCGDLALASAFTQLPNGLTQSYEAWVGCGLHV